MPKKTKKFIATNYDIEIEKGRSDINDKIFEFLLPRLEGYVLDAGANTGYLISQYKGKALGIDISPIMVDIAVKKGRNVVRGNVVDLPFKQHEFDTVVLSCVLEQIEDWETALSECLRVGKRVIGINPIPGVDRWGFKQGWVKSIIPSDYLQEKYNAKIEPFDFGRYYFEMLS